MLTAVSNITPRPSFSTFQFSGLNIPDQFGAVQRMSPRLLREELALHTVYFQTAEQRLLFQRLCESPQAIRHWTVDYHPTLIHSIVSFPRAAAAEWLQKYECVPGQKENADTCIISVASHHNRQSQRAEMLDLKMNHLIGLGQATETDRLRAFSITADFSKDPLEWLRQVIQVSGHDFQSLITETLVPCVLSSKGIFSKDTNPAAIDFALLVGTLYYSAQKTVELPGLQISGARLYKLLKRVV